MFEGGGINNGLPKVSKSNTLIVTVSRRIYNYYKERDISVISLSAYMGISPKDKIFPLYTVWSYYFDGEIDCDEDMILMLHGAVIEDRDWVYCLCIDKTFCWFSYDSERSEIKVMGSMSLTEPVSSYSIGKFLNRLRYNLVNSGASLMRTVFLSYGDFIFKDYIASYRDFGVMLNSIQGLDSQTLQGVYSKLSNTLCTKDKDITASDMLKALSDSCKALGLRFNGNKIDYRRVYYKDYSICTCSNYNKKNVSYSLVIDCEGVSGNNGALQNGFRQMGVIFCAEFDDKILSMYKFTIEKELLLESLENIPSLYKDLTDRNIPVGGIPTYIFGASDKIMIESQIELSDRRVRKRLTGVFDFIDVKYDISRILDNGGMTSKRTLQNIARFFGVYAVRPKHNALSDARTLFNILAVIKKGDYNEIKRL